MKRKNRLLALLMAFLLALLPLAACGQDDTLVAIAVTGDTDTTAPATDETQPTTDAVDLGPAVTGTQTLLRGDTVLDEEGWYSDRDTVALYLMAYGDLPGNFITKNEARDLGWEGGGLDPFAPGCSIGGDHFGNYEGALPEGDGRSYTECDIDTQGADSRGAKRLVFSNDGLIFYTDDHYETFILLEEGD